MILLHFVSDEWDYFALPLPRLNEPLHEKTNKLGFRPGLTQTSLYCLRRRLDLGKRGIVLSVKRKQSADQLCSYCTADLRVCFRLSMLLLFFLLPMLIDQCLTKVVRDDFVRLVSRTFLALMSLVPFVGRGPTVYPQM